MAGYYWTIANVTLLDVEILAERDDFDPDTRTPMYLHCWKCGDNDFPFHKQVKITNDSGVRKGIYCNSCIANLISLIEEPIKEVDPDCR
jgi:hypothetical protein